MTTTAAGSLVYGVGNDWDSATPRPLGAGQTMVHEFGPSVGDDLWIQRLTNPVAASGTTATVGATAPTADRWNMVAVEILPRPPSGGTSTTLNTVADGLAASEIVYDLAGNTKRLADMQFGYDATGRHSATTYDDGSAVTIARDASGRVVARTTDPAGPAPAVTVTYLYNAGADVPWGRKTGAALTCTTGLPGGVTLTRAGSTTTWSYPNLLGHALATGNGTSTGNLLLSDPFGQPLDPTTLAIGTAASDDTGTTAGNTGWHQGALKSAETVGSTTLIEMGARLYVAALGRFLQIDRSRAASTTTTSGRPTRSVAATFPVMLKVMNGGVSPAQSRSVLLRSRGQLLVPRPWPAASRRLWRSASRPVPPAMRLPPPAQRTSHGQASVRPRLSAVLRVAGCLVLGQVLDL